MQKTWPEGRSSVEVLRQDMVRNLEFGGHFKALYPGEREAMILALVCAIDMLTTLWWVTHGIASEANPILAWTLQHHPLLFVLFKCATFLVPLFLVTRLGRERPEFTRCALSIACIAYITIYTLAVF